jgi:pseudaminic acid cytidylyltransferase
VKVAIIPARGGSVRVPRKNVRPFYGKPILHYSIEAAKKSLLFDRVIVSTDDEQIASVAKVAGAEVMMRPPGLEEVGTQEIGRLVVERLSDGQHVPKFACVVYATVPMLKPEDLIEGFHVMQTRHPLFAFSVGAAPLRDAGMFYWGEGWAFVARVPLVSPRSCMVPIPENRICDINTEGDWKLAEEMYARMAS